MCVELVTITLVLQSPSVSIPYSSVPPVLNERAVVFGWASLRLSETSLFVTDILVRGKG